MAKKQTQITKVQHYVPQLYLSGFLNETKRMFCYDKKNNKTYPVKTEDVCQEKYFYEIPPGTAEQEVPLNTVEHAFGDMEKAYAPRLANLIRSTDEDMITSEQLAEFSPFVVIQWMRTKTFRIQAYESIVKHSQTLVDDLVKLNEPKAEGKLSYKLDEECMPAAHAELMFNPEGVLRKARDLDKLYWIVGISKGSQLFYTSDNPVVRRGNCGDAFDPRLLLRR